MPRERFFNAVRQKRCNRGAGTRKSADKETDERTIQKSKAAVLEILQGRQQVSQPF
jgi:hypothetical protein